ncbi:hypothetical protein [Cellulosimicrobium cellulans]|uniref:hypothetical protein n=1 Tax=Cellulosimicrobium cellulans TaxID=1710 RepID=UPI00130DCC9F|nr:hypothetical protein [Cellulosimicrobium cellulans]
MSIRDQYPNVDAELALLAEGDNDPDQIVAGSLHIEEPTGNTVFTYAGPGDVTYGDLARSLAIEDSQ